MRPRPAPSVALALAAVAAIACARPSTSSRRRPSVESAVAGEMARAGEARVIVTYDANASMPAGLRVARAYRHVNAFAATIDRRELDALRETPGVRAIGLDERGAGHLLEALPLAGFTAPHASGLGGEGTTVAVLDTGVRKLHPDLIGTVIDEACFCTGCCAGGADQALGEGSADDDNGHGTHVAGIVASQGTVAPTGGASGAQIIAVKVLDQDTGLDGLSDVVAAIEWLIDTHPEVDVVNMSFGTGSVYPGDCDGESASISALADAVHQLEALGAVLVASSGNHGSSTALPPPACIGSVISVGAVWDEDVGPESILCQEAMTAPDRIACFSDASPTLDMLAPGARIVSTWPPNLALGRVGTSAAAPIVSACAALLREASPSASLEAMTSALHTSPALLLDARNGLSFPRLDCGAALLALTDSSDGGFDAGLDAGFDAGEPDAAIDAGEIDAGEIDAGASDAGASDAEAQPDAAPSLDAGELDATALPDATDEPAADAGADAMIAVDAALPMEASLADGSDTHMPGDTGLDAPAGDAANDAGSVPRIDDDGCACSAPGALHAPSPPLGALALGWCSVLLARSLRRKRSRRDR